MNSHPYPTHKPSGVSWLGEVPSHWEVRRLKFSAPFRTRKLDSKPEKAIYVGLENIESWTGRLLLDKQPDSVDGIVGFFNAGDVLFGKLRPYLAKSAFCVQISKVFPQAKSLLCVHRMSAYRAT